MKNFENLKKALAVSVCSSILFSGAPKTSGKEGSWYKVVYKRISENQSIDIITFFTTQSRFFIFLN